MRSFVLLLIAVAASQSAWAGMYKWVDEKGITHYGDTIPPQYVNQANTELNKWGVTVKKTDAALTQEQIKAREDEVVRKKEDAVKAAEQKRKDKALLNTYTNEKEIDLARNRNLQQVDLVIESTGVRMKAVKARLDKARQQADAATKAKKPVPQGVAEDLKEAEQEMKRLEEIVAQKKQEKDAINARFDDDKKRYSELAAAERSAGK